MTRSTVGSWNPHSLGIALVVSGMAIVSATAWFAFVIRGNRQPPRQMDSTTAEEMTPREREIARLSGVGCALMALAFVIAVAMGFAFLYHLSHVSGL